VVIPAWDDYAGTGLRDAVASVRRQSIEAETIVVDNASSSPISDLDGLRVTRLERRRSTGGARNEGLALVRTPLVVFLDADDTLLDGALEGLIDGLERHPGAAAYVMSIIDGTTGRRHRTPRRLARELARVPPLFALANAIWSLVPTQGCAIMRTEPVREAGGFADSDHGEDWVLATSLAFRGRVVFDGRPALLYRLHEDSPGVGATRMSVLLTNARRVRERMRSDPAVPRWARAALPVVTLGQWLAVVAVRPVVRAARLARRA
jgi:glycosyltransferase involved in cell wall biosynthesis